MRLNPNYKHNQQAFGFPSLHMHLAMYILSALVNICSQAVKINWRFNFFRGLSNCLQNSFIAYRRWQWVCECVFVYLVLPVHESVELWFHECLPNVRPIFGGEYERIDSQSAKATMFQCCTLDISIATFFCVWKFLITFLARLWSRRDQIEKGYPTVDGNWTRLKQMFVCEFGALCVYWDLCTATRLLHTIKYHFEKQCCWVTHIVCYQNVKTHMWVCNFCNFISLDKFVVHFIHGWHSHNFGRIHKQAHANNSYLQKSNAEK